MAIILFAQSLLINYKIARQQASNNSKDAIAKNQNQRTLSEHRTETASVRGTLSEHRTETASVRGTLSEHCMEIASVRGTPNEHRTDTVRALSGNETLGSLCCRSVARGHCWLRMLLLEMPLCGVLFLGDAAVCRCPCIR